ncbi:MAG: hypothetical protein GWO39_13175, partial [Gammaproteobacteria bacterium]|nr:hypothetical protein [Gammaproteobacteria bacterium]NIT64677.1 hypothetical protein [Gammaproteobacteria bacterium]NIV21638.1 hypothetical protein [Gammaproteobacteria bacterium]NIY33257.1 hypothetical protein [Gammaproteobacteria bacterium]
LLPALLLLASWAAPAVAQQTNFEPLERGEYTELEERLIVMRGLEVSADYAFATISNQQNDLDRDVDGTNTGHDLRLNLDTVFHRDVRLHLTLQL